MASWAMLAGVPTAGVGAVTMMSAAPANSKGKKTGGGGGGGGLLDWLNGALDKESFSETDPILQKVEGASKKPSSSPGGGPALSPKSKQSSSGGGGSGGGGLFGLFGKK